VSTPVIKSTKHSDDVKTTDKKGAMIELKTAIQDRKSTDPLKWGRSNVVDI
jgi:hypothetical protein